MQTPEPRPDIPLERVQPIVDRLKANLKATAVVPLRGGNISDLYEIQVSEGPGVVLKVYPDQLHWKMKKELLVYGWLQAQTDLPTPRILAFDDSKELLPQTFVVMSKLEGQSLKATEASLSEVELHAAYAEMGRMLKTIHGLPMASFGYIGADGIMEAYPTNEAYMAHQFRKKINAFIELGGDADLADRMLGHVAVTATLLSTCKSPVLCHDDFHAGNIMASKDDGGTWKVTGLLDVENAIAGDPLIDIAKTLAYSVGDNKAKREGFFHGYGPIERPDWEKTVDLYRLYHALEYWVWASSNGQTPPPWLIKDMQRLVV